MNLKNRDLEYQNLIQSNNLTLPTKNDSTLFYTDIVISVVVMADLQLRKSRIAR